MVCEVSLVKWGIWGSRQANQNFASRHQASLCQKSINYKKKKIKRKSDFKVEKLIYCCFKSSWSFYFISLKHFKCFAVSLWTRLRFHPQGLRFVFKAGDAQQTSALMHKRSIELTFQVVCLIPRQRKKKIYVGLLFLICLRERESEQWSELKQSAIHRCRKKEKKRKCASSELRIDLKTFKDKFTNKTEPFDFKRVTKKKKTVETLFGGHVSRSLF